MKAVKIIVGIFVLLLVLSTAGFYFFLKTFDANKFLPQITRQATEMIGRSLQIGQARVGFSLFDGVALQVKDIVLADDPKFSDKPFLKIDRIDIGFDLRALILQRKIQLTQIVIVSPQVVVIRSKEGMINVATIGPKPAVASSGSAIQLKGDAAAALPALLVNDIKVMNARVTYLDEMFTPRLAIQTDRIDINVHDFSLTDPFSLMMKASLFSTEQDVNVDAKVALDLFKQSLDLRGVIVQVDLARFDISRLGNELPMLKVLALKKLEGIFKVSLSDLRVSSAGLSGFKGQVLFDKGLVLSDLFPVPAENIQIRADVDERNINVEVFSCVLVEGVVTGKALVSDYLLDPAVSITFDAGAINVQKLVEGYKVPVIMSGLVSATGDLKFSGKTPEQIMLSLNGSIKGELNNGVLENLNLFALGLGNIPMLPGLLDSVMVELPSETQEDIKKGITRFDMCKVQAHVVNGLMGLDMADIRTRELGLHATGTIDLMQNLSIKADIRVDKKLSERLSAKVKELSYLKDEEGKIYLPVTLTGPATKPVFMPDVEYLTKKLVLAAGGEELQKALGGSPAAAETVGAIFDLFRKK